MMRERRRSTAGRSWFYPFEDREPYHVFSARHELPGSYQAVVLDANSQIVTIQFIDSQKGYALLRRRQSPIKRFLLRVQLDESLLRIVLSVAILIDQDVPHHR